MAVKMTCADGIQEYIETLRDLKAANAENAYLTGLSDKIRTVAGADKIVVLADGVVAEQGAPQELYAQNGLYNHMADLQTGAQNRTI